MRKTTDYEKEIFKRVLNKDIDEIYEPVGCDECSRGYRGRIAIHEVLLLNQVIKDAITKGTSKDILRKLVYGEEGTETMLHDGLEKVLEGKTSFEEILKLIDLDDDLGSDTQLGLDDQIDASRMVNSPTYFNSNQPININITEEVLKSLNALNNKVTSTEEDRKKIPSIENEVIDESEEKTEEENIIAEPVDYVQEESHMTPFDELEKLDEEKYDLSKKDYNDKLNIILNKIDVRALENQNEIDNYLIHLSLIEGDSLIYKNNNKIIERLIEELNNNSEYVMESSEIELPELNKEIDDYDNKIELNDSDIDIDDVNVIDISNQYDKKDVLNDELDTNNDEFDNLEDVDDILKNDKIYLDESDLDIDDNLNIEEIDNDDVLDDVYFDDLIDENTIDDLLNEMDFEE